MNIQTTHPDLCLVKVLASLTWDGGYSSFLSERRNAPPEKKRRGTSCFQTTRSGGGEQFVPLDSMAKACVKGVVLLRAKTTKQNIFLKKNKTKT